MMTLKQLKAQLNQIGPEYDGTLVVQSSGDHGYCGVGFSFEDAEKAFGNHLFEYYDDRNMQTPESVKIKVMVVR